MTRLLRSPLAGLVLVLLLTVGFAGLQPLPGEQVPLRRIASTGTCGVERWAVKTGTDADAPAVDQMRVSPTTIGYLGSIPAPAQLPPDTRVRPTELTVFSVAATLTAYKLEADSDYHLILADAQGHTMIAEAPDPACVGPTSPFRAAISQVRSVFDAHLTATTTFKTANLAVRVTGVGFFDDLHGQAGAALNGIELHPVLGLTFDPSTGTTGCSTTLPDGSVVGAAATPSGNGYVMASQAGAVSVFGDAGCRGSLAGLPLTRPVVTVTTTATGAGYWLLGGDGGIFAFGDARFFGSTGNISLNQPVVAMAAVPEGAGYRFVAADGGVFSYGTATFKGSLGGSRLNKPIVGMASTPSGQGYWLVAADGGIFAFGDARFFGSTGNIPLNRPIVAMTPTPSGAGYWLVAADGGIFAFGDARFFGSAGAINLRRPIVAAASTPTGLGYWLFATDGGVFSYGDARFFGSAVAPPTVAPPGSASCAARMDNPTPAQYSTVHVLVSSNLPNASVTTTAHYRTTDTPKTGTTNTTGAADIPYSISGAAIGYTVGVDVTVGSRTSCSTSFTPR